MYKIGINPATYATTSFNSKHDAKAQTTRTNLKKD
jgi:hypothetical protein